MRKESPSKAKPSLLSLLREQGHFHLLSEPHVVTATVWGQLRNYRTTAQRTPEPLPRLPAQFLYSAATRLLSRDPEMAPDLLKPKQAQFSLGTYPKAFSVGLSLEAVSSRSPFCAFCSGTPFLRSQTLFISSLGALPLSSFTCSEDSINHRTKHKTHKKKVRMRHSK